MSKVFVVGTGPLLESGHARVSGQSLRTWHFCAPLLAAGHEVRLMTIPIPGTNDEDADPPVQDAVYGGLKYKRFLSNSPWKLPTLISGEIDAFQPDFLLGINAYPAYLLAVLDRPEPFWADLNGWTMVEGQIKAARDGHDRHFGHFWRLEAMTLLQADRFSTVTERQQWALYGELAMLGRLDHRTFSDEFAVTVPNAVYPDYAEAKRREKPAKILAGKVPAEAAICLWSGGFNSWTDVDLLAAALMGAFEKAPALHFVATGGGISGHDEETYARFVDLVKVCLPEDRVHLLGWVDYSDVLELHGTADFGINVDGVNQETRFGARNRLTNMMGAGLPVVTTRGTEIAEWIFGKGAGLVTPPGDAEALAAALATMANDGELRSRFAEKARKQSREEFAAKATLGKFLKWASNPCRASDRLIPIREGESSTALLREWVHDQIRRPVPFEVSTLPTNCEPVQNRHGSLPRRVARAIKKRVIKKR